MTIRLSFPFNVHSSEYKHDDKRASLHAVFEVVIASNNLQNFALVQQQKSGL